MSSGIKKLFALCGPLLAVLLTPQVAVGQASTGPSPGGRAAAKNSALDAKSELERARSLYQAGSYKRCRETYSRVFGSGQLPGNARPETIEQGRLYYASCLLAQGQADEADTQLRAALAANPLMASPDPVLFPTKVRELFFQVKGNFLEEIRVAQEKKLQQARMLAEEKERQARAEQARVANLERLATQETVVHQNRRWIAAIPFGVGQFQNGDDALGTLLLGTEMILLGTTIIAVSRELSLHSQADGGSNVEGVADEFTSAIRLARNVGNIASASFLLVAVVGVAEAQINFVPEQRLGNRPRNAGPGMPSEPAAPRRRPTEPRPRGPRSSTQSGEASGLKWRPILSADSTSGFIGVAGTF